MSEWNGKLLLPQLIQKLAGWSEHAKAAWMRLRSLPPPVKLASWLMLLVLAASVMGCAAISTPPSNMPRNPEPPPSRLPESPLDYLKRALDFLSMSRKQLTELTQNPAN